jgi:uncharacterized membrane protein YphA (DoxX/SURF4 family)
METVLWYLGRLLFGGYFIYGGIGHLTKLGMMAGYAKSKGVPAATAAVAFTGLLLIIGGASVLLNLYTTIGLIALSLFLVPVTFMMHQFWKIQDPMAKMGEMINFTKNLALLGAVLILLSR